jgi:hypothetical protein
MIKKITRQKKIYKKFLLFFFNINILYNLKFSNEECHKKSFLKNTGYVIVDKENKKLVAENKLYINNNETVTSCKSGVALNKDKQEGYLTIENKNKEETLKAEAFVLSENNNTIGAFGFQSITDGKEQKNYNNINVNGKFISTKESTQVQSNFVSKDNNTYIAGQLGLKYTEDNLQIQGNFIYQDQNTSQQTNKTKSNLSVSLNNKNCSLKIGQYEISYDIQSNISSINCSNTNNNNSVEISQSINQEQNRSKNILKSSSSFKSYSVSNSNSNNVSKSSISNSSVKKGISWITSNNTSNVNNNQNSIYNSDLQNQPSNKINCNTPDELTKKDEISNLEKLSDLSQSSSSINSNLSNVNNNQNSICNSDLQNQPSNKIDCNTSDELTKKDEISNSNILFPLIVFFNCFLILSILYQRKNSQKKTYTDNDNYYI